MRLALTMRCIQADGYDDPRDALATDWAAWLEHVLPGVPWLPLPNLGSRIAAVMDQWEISGVILTGGNDLGTCPRRDATEMAIIDCALQSRLPIFGVCRGLQLLHKHLGGELAPCRGHAGSRHPIQILSEMFGQRPGRREVNSYHNWCLPAAVPDMHVLAVDEQGMVEAAVHHHFPLAGVLWHPEREHPMKASDTDMLRNFFSWGVNRS